MEAMMRIFISVGEPSGDLHGANLIRALQRFDPNIEFVGFGGERMAATGCRLLYPLCQLAVMWIARVLANIHVFLRLASEADRFFRHHRPDAVILIDYPGFNGVIGRRAHFHGIPVFYFGPPQLWGWAGWRVKGLRKWVDHILCKLPFEEAWFAERGVKARYVGHPYFDELHGQRLDRDFLQSQRKDGNTIIGLLPGSRTQEVEKNFSSMARAAARIHEQRPDTRFLVACFRDAHRAMIQSKIDRYQIPAEVYVGRTPEIIDLAHSCIAVSGSVSLELLYRETPTVILYRIGKFDLKVCNFFKTSPFITLVNMMAGKELFPEFLVDHCPAKGMADQVSRWLDNADAHAQVRDELAALRERVGQPGACERTARFIWGILNGQAVPSSGEDFSQHKQAA
jgi:lipid-A-disaccharide synthase